MQVDQKTWSPTIDSSPPSMYEGKLDMNRPWLVRAVDSLKRDPDASVTRQTSVSAKLGEEYDVETAAQATAASPLLRKLRGRHLQMIAIGGSIGTGLFVGSGKALAAGGPASLVIAFSLISIMMYCTLQALGEMAVVFPVAGSFATFSTRFLDPAWGFAMGWNYALGWLVTLPLEIVSASITVDFWTDDRSLNAAWVSIFLVVIVSINFFGVKGYGEAEFVFSIIKVTAVIGYIILGVIMNIASGPDGSYIGFKYWRDPGAFHNGFWGLCSTFVTAAFAFTGTELIGLTAAETESPRKTLPTAIKQAGLRIFWRISLFYIVSLFLVGTLVPYTDQRLLDANSSVDAKASPFVISIQNAGIEVLPDIMNVVIMVSVLSVGNSAVYGSSRTLAALAEASQAPRMFAYIDRKGRPLVTIAISSICGFLAFLAASDKQEAAFNWMLSISSLSSLFTWASVCLCHIRFRQAWISQGHGLDELAFKSPLGAWGSWIGFILNILVLIAQLWTAITPEGWQEKTSGQIAENFFQAYLAAPVVIIFFLFYKIRYRTKVVRTRDIDLFTGKREMNIKGLLREERGRRRNWPRWKRIYRLFC